ncbi:MAG: EAL domain-containing protein [Moraxellaceae bacterium]|nr:EAL domain-containing protein [Moraxellaceae bacterium]
MYFQPKINPITGEIVGAEVLLRWKHPQRGMVSP